MLFAFIRPPPQCACSKCVSSISTYSEAPQVVSDELTRCQYQMRRKCRSGCVPSPGCYSLLEGSNRCAR